MTQRSGGKLLVECLTALGVRQSFGVPGESYLSVLDALHDVSGELTFTVCRNEGGAAFMAASYGKLTGSPGICFVTRGPGATNASIGVHTAMQDSVPMILFIGQVSTKMRDREAFQEIDYRAFYGSAAKWVVEIGDVDRIPEMVSRAWTCALSGRPGPVVVALPEDVLTDRSWAPVLTGPATVEEPFPSPSALAALKSILAQSERPLAILGGSGWSSEGRVALQQFAERSDIPVLASFRRVDVFDNHSPAYVGDAGVGMTSATKNLIEQADAILALNIRFGEMTTNGYTLLQTPKAVQKLIHVHSSARELGKIYVPDLAIHAGPNAFASALAKHKVSGSWTAWRAKARAEYENEFALPELPSPVDMGKVMVYLSARLPADAILTCGAGNFTTWSNRYFKYGPDQRLLGPQSGAMGYGLPAAISAKLAYPNRTVVCFAGDGDFQMTCQELGTGMQAGAQPIVLILNNGIYGTIRMHQERDYPNRVYGTHLANPNFALLAKSYGYHAEQVSETSQFSMAFERALASKTGAVLDLVISPEAITPRQTLHEIGDSAKPR